MSALLYLGSLFHCTEIFDVYKVQSYSVDVCRMQAYSLDLDTV